MSKLLITTQVYENYAWREDGTLGTGANAYWKAKGGNEYVIKQFRGGDEAATKMVMAVRDRIEESNDGYREHIVDWEVVADDYLTEFERSQLEYDGSIMFPAQELQVA
jgi:hypothetical protein